MCGGGGGDGGSKELAEQQRREQEARERRIRRGMEQIEALFEGGHTGSSRADSFDPGQTYYDSAGNVVFTPERADKFRTSYADEFRGLEGGYSEQDAGVQQRARAAVGKGPSFLDEDAREVSQLNERLRDIGIEDTVDTFSELRDPWKVFNRVAKDGLLFTDRKRTQGFTDDFYDKRRRDYLDYANPIAEEQYNDATEDLTFALSRAGTLDSSVAADRFGDTEKQYREARRQIADRAESRATDARRAVADERNRLTQLVHATGDPSASLAGVGDVLRTLRSDPGLDPIGPIFQNVTAGIGNYAQGRRDAEINRRVRDLFRGPNEGSARQVRG